MICVLMVCLGNICRSPLAEGILKSKVDTKKIIVDSAGTADFNVGSLPDRRSVEISQKYSIDITYQRARVLSQIDFDNFDFIYAMDKSNYEDILKITRNKDDKLKVKLILNELYPGENRDIPDPYYGDLESFENVYQLLDASCEIIANKLK